MKKIRPVVTMDKRIEYLQGSDYAEYFTKTVLKKKKQQHCNKRKRGPALRASEFEHSYASKRKGMFLVCNLAYNNIEKKNKGNSLNEISLCNYKSALTSGTLFNC